MKRLGLENVGFTGLSLSINLICFYGGKADFIWKFALASDWFIYNGNEC